MLNRVNEILIGKNIIRTATLTAGDDVMDINSEGAAGEILVVSEDFKIVDATPTYLKYNKIRIVEVTDQVTSFTHPTTGLETSMIKLIVSSLIDGRFVKTYKKSAYTAKAEKTITFPAITDAIVAGTEYVIRLVYKDMIEHPGQYTETYRYVAKTGDASVDVFDGIRKRINSYKGTLSIKGGARVYPNALAAATLILTARPIPECTTSLFNIDPFSQVDFEAFFNFVDNDGIWTEVGLATVKVYTLPVRGSGIWELIRDTEKQAQSYRGIDNRIWFPIALPEQRTVKGVTYHSFVIEHETQYLSADNQYLKKAPKTEQIAIDSAAPTTTGAHQGENVEALLDAWMATLPVPKEDSTDLVFPPTA